MWEFQQFLYDHLFIFVVSSCVVSSGSSDQATVNILNTENTVPNLENIKNSYRHKLKNKLQRNKATTMWSEMRAITAHNRRGKVGEEDLLQVNKLN